jgi:indolepyruvate ferredoxin oxidoreductase beta subunit
MSPPRKTDKKLQTIIKVAILAVGGQGGGVLTNWIENVARSQGYASQATSVAGVAQRTGATIYYIEMAPAGSRMPIFSLAPSAGDVDIMIAAEMMEAGRAIMRGFVTPDRTTLIISTHRALAVSEKMVPGDGIASSEEVGAAAEIAAKKLIMFDMDRLAVENGSVISSSLLGALAASKTLPFSRKSFEEAIRSSGKGVKESLNAFNKAYERANNPVAETTEVTQKTSIEAVGPAKLLSKWSKLLNEAKTMTSSEMAELGLRKVVKFQDMAYGREYLDRLKPWAEADNRNGKLVAAAAKHIANAMVYDDVIRVADLKTRKERFDRIDAEMKSGKNPVHLTEFMHPRAEEIVGMLPAGLGRRIEKHPRVMGWIDRRVNKSRRVRTHRITGFFQLYALGWLRGMRRHSLRHAYEVEHMSNWLAVCHDALQRDYDSAVELLKCRRLVKGYSDTHSRTSSKFDQVMKAYKLVKGRDDAAIWIVRLRDAAMQDPEGDALSGAIKTIKSFAADKPRSGKKSK